jgi:hypothetical protein
VSLMSIPLLKPTQSLLECFNTQLQPQHNKFERHCHLSWSFSNIVTETRQPCGKSYTQDLLVVEPGLMTMVQSAYLYLITIMWSS